MVCTSQGTFKNGVCILPREEWSSEFQCYEFGVLCLILVSSDNQKEKVSVVHYIWETCQLDDFLKIYCVS